MTIKVRPIRGEDPGLCDSHRDGKSCVEEAVVHATVPIPGLDGVTVNVRWCRLCWADFDEVQERGPRKIEVEPMLDIDIDEAIRQGEDEGE